MSETQRMDVPPDMAALKAGAGTMAIGSPVMLGLTPDEWVTLASMATVGAGAITVVLGVLRVIDWIRGR